MSSTNLLGLDFEPYTGSKKSRTTFQKSLIERAITSCNTQWFKTSWLGISIYIAVSCLNYIIGYYGIYRGMGWITHAHSSVRVFGDLVTVSWFALGFVTLPWHQWEELTCIKTRDWAGFGRFMAWWLGTIITFFIYGYMRENPLFQTSLSSDLTTGQRSVYVVVFIVLFVILMYWVGKLYPCGNCQRLCDPESSRKVIFIRIFALIVGLFVISYLVCDSESCEYHLHHWWFGFVLIMLSSASLDNWFDYFLQGVFWTFLTESIFNYRIVFGRFFV